MAGKLRSPNYPAFGLGQAVEAAGKLWNSEKRTPVSHETAAVALGYKSLSGPARVAIGTLRQFGFIDKAEKGHIRLSDLAVRVLHGSAEERQAALKQAAINPPLFKELAQNHTDASETAIRSYLITKKGFAEDGARKAARAFRDTLKFAKLEASGYTANDGGKEPEDMTGIDTGQDIKDVGAWTGDSGKGQDRTRVLSLNVPFANGSLMIQVRVTGDTLKAAHIQRVRRYLELAEADLESGDS